MFGTHFYHQRIRKAVASFGKLFNNIYIIRRGPNNTVANTQRVPIKYAHRKRMLDRIEQEDLPGDTQVAIKLPRMSFEIAGFSYEDTQQLSKNNTITLSSGGAARETIYTPVPYNINFQLHVYSKDQEDGLQVAEQIIPFFNPTYSWTQLPFDAYPEHKEDVSLILNGFNFTDTNENQLGDRRVIIHTFDFNMKMRFYGPVGTSSIIRHIETETGLITGDSCVSTSIITTTPTPFDVGPDSDFGFSQTKNDLFE